MIPYWLQGRLQGLWCRLKGHEVEWYACAENEFCKGDIICATCDTLIWCRALDPMWLTGVNKDVE